MAAKQHQFRNNILVGEMNLSIINFANGGNPHESGISNELADSAHSRSRFSFVPETTPRQITKLSVVLVVGFNNEIAWVGILRKSSRVATAQYNFSAFALQRIESDSLWLEYPVTLRNRISPYFQEFISHIPEGAGNELLDFFRHQYPDILSHIERLQRDITEERTIFSQPELVAFQQRDAVSTALALFGDNDAAMRAKSKIPTGTVSFISELSSGRVLEDQVIAHDWGVFSDWTEADRQQIDAIKVFEKGDRKLAILNVNRDGIENALGTDLVYINETDQTVIFVQYKMMSNRTSSGDSYYNPNEQSQQTELQRMQNANSAIRRHVSTRTNNRICHLRLHEGPFFFKLCEATNLEKSDSKIAKGMYVPLFFWEKLLTAPETNGPNGGKQFGLHTLAHRYLHATSFVQLFDQTLIGTNVNSWDLVSGWIKALVVNSRRSAVIAIADQISRVASGATIGMASDAAP